MELSEMEEFFKEYEDIPYEEKAISYLAGIAMTSEKWEIVEELLNSDKDFDEVFSELENTVKDDVFLTRRKFLQGFLNTKKSLKNRTLSTNARNRQATLQVRSRIFLRHRNSNQVLLSSCCLC